MEEKMNKFFLFLCMSMIVFWHIELAQAAPRNASTGDLGHNVIYLGGTYTDFLDISRPSKIEQATMTILFLHYDSPEVPVDVVLNREYIGSFLAEPFGPEEAIFDVTGLLVNGENEIHFQGNHAPDHPDLDPGNYLIAQIDIDYFESETSIPIAEAGPDGIVFNEVFLDGSGSSDSDGAIISYEWELEHRTFPAYNRSAGGQRPTATILNLEPGFYDVMLTVTDDDPEALTDTDTMVLAVAGGQDASGLYTQAQVDQMVAEAVAEVEAAKDAVIAGLGQTIDERNAAIVELNKAIADLSGAMAEKDTLIDGLGQTIDERNAAIVELNDTIAELRGAIAEKEAVIAGQNQTIDERNAAIEELNDTIAELRGVIAAKEAVVAGQTQTIDERNAAIEELNDTIAELRGVIAAKEAVVAGQTQTINELNATIAALTGTIAEKDAEVAGLNQTIDELNATIDTMYTKEELDQAIEDALAGKSGKHKKSKDHKKNHKKSKDYEKKHGKSDDHEKKHSKSKNKG